MTTSDSGSKAERFRAAIDAYGAEASMPRYYEETSKELAEALAILAEAEQETAAAIEALRVATRERDEALANLERYKSEWPERFGGAP